VEIAYKASSTGKETTRKIAPYQMWAMNGGFYLIGLCNLRNSVRTFALERVKNLSVLDEPFHFPERFLLGGIPADGLPGHAGRSQDLEDTVLSWSGTGCS
jgi:hypothetical protein